MFFCQKTLSQISNRVLKTAIEREMFFNLDNSANVETSEDT